MTAPAGSSVANERVANGQTEPWKVKYIGIGNENWGCGGSMDPEYYASEYKRYQQFCKDCGDNHLYKIACGPNSEDYHWTEELMKRINRWHARAISLHYYTVPGDWDHKGSATEFDDKEYYITIQKALHIADIIDKHLEIMDKYDPEHDISLIVDEWGTWYDVEPGTNPGFLYQQNTIRDAIVAAANLNIFNARCDRISMANIAQMVNVLQAMLLTEGNDIVKTPTYYVFGMYKNHQGAELVESSVDEVTVGSDDISVGAVSQSVSVKDDTVTITLSNASLNDEIEVKIEFSENVLFTRPVEITVLTGDVRACNTFDNPENIVPEYMTDDWNGGERIVKLPAASVVTVICHVRK